MTCVWHPCVSCDRRYPDQGHEKQRNGFESQFVLASSCMSFSCSWESCRSKCARNLTDLHKPVTTSLQKTFNDERNLIPQSSSHAERASIYGSTRCISLLNLGSQRRMMFFVIQPKPLLRRWPVAIWPPTYSVP